MASTYEKLNLDYSNELKLALIIKHPFVWSSIKSNMVLKSVRDEEEIKSMQIQDKNSKFRLILETMFPLLRLEFILDSMSREQLLMLHNLLLTDQTKEMTITKFPFIKKYTSSGTDEFKLNKFFTLSNERSKVPINYDLLLLIIQNKYSEILKRMRLEQEIIESQFKDTPANYKQYDTIEDLCFQCDIQKAEVINFQQ